MRKKKITRLLTLVVAMIAVIGLGTTAAFAHVTVSSPAAVKGGYATVTVKVPTESDTASTTSLKLQLPTDAPLASVSIQPKAGWTYQVIKSKLDKPIAGEGAQITETVSEIDWTATDGGIKPGEFDTFVISIGALPKDKDSLSFKAIQTYSDGSVVSWVEQATGGTEPDHPAPTLALTAAAAAANSPSDQGAATQAATSAGSANATSDSTGTVGVILGAIALILAAAALVLVMRKRKLEV